MLEVWLYQDPPPALADPSLWSLEQAPGGTPVAIAAASIAATPSPHLELELAGLPDPARYRLVVEPPASVAFDPLRTWLPARLRPECPELGACFDVGEPPPPPPPSPVLDYRPRDWRSLRQALVEYVLRRDPDADVSIADPTITVAELFAHVGDLLNYRLDRVATESYLETARLRTSVRRHARLVDFAVDDGAAAETFVHVTVAPNASAVTVAAGSVAVDVSASDLAFTLEADLAADARLAEIPIYDWGEEACCLSAGATECVLVRPLAADPLGDAWLAAGDLLVFEVVDPDDEARHASWARRLQLWPTDAGGDPRFRAPLPSRLAQVVHLTEVAPFADPLLGVGLALYRVRWAPDDALARPYPVGVDTSTGAAEVTVARANLVPAHHGRLVDGPARGDTRPAPPRLGRSRGRSAERALARRCGQPWARPERGRPGPVDRAGPRTRPPRAGAAPARRLRSAFRPASPFPPPGSAACSTRAPASTPSSSTPRSRSRRSCASRPVPWARRRPSAASCRPPTRSAAARVGTSPRTRSACSSRTPPSRGSRRAGRRSPG